jgi:hypothetical protein
MTRNESLTIAAENIARAMQAPAPLAAALWTSVDGVFASDVKLLFPGAELDRGDAAQ